MPRTPGRDGRVEELTVKCDIALGDACETVTLVRRDGATLSFAGRDYPCTLQEVGAGEYRLSMDGKTHRVWIAVHKRLAYVHAFGRVWELEVIDPVERASRGAGGSEDITIAPMPGTVVTLFVREGEPVRKGQPLLVIESMKMQTEIVALRNGKVERVFVAPGQTFARGTRLVALAGEE